MSFEFRGVESAGDIDRERVILLATSDVDIGHYAVFRCRVGSDDSKILSGDIPQAYWFPDKKIKSGDFVILYTKSGSASEKIGQNGSTSYFYYWGKSATQWKGYSSVLARTGSDWSRKGPY